MRDKHCLKEDSLTIFCTRYTLHYTCLSWFYVIISNAIHPTKLNLGVFYNDMCASSLRFGDTQILTLILIELCFFLFVSELFSFVSNSHFLVTGAASNGIMSNISIVDSYKRFMEKNSGKSRFDILL